jgi:hypothetical protein
MTSETPTRLSAERAAEEEREAQRYADRILDGRHDWSAINAEIEQRWSLTALRRVKERAWVIVGERRP